MRRIEWMMCLILVSVNIGGCAGVTGHADIEQEDIRDAYRDGTEAEMADVGKTGAECTEKTDTGETDVTDREIIKEMQETAETYRDIYQQAYTGNRIGTLEVRQKIVKRLGQDGCAVVDKENEINMENYEKVEAFCQQVSDKKKGALTILAVLNDGGFWRYEFQTCDGKVQIRNYFLTWRGMEPQVKVSEAFQACFWNYTENGYLFFEQYYPSGYDGDSGHTAIRVKPLDEKCRAYNRAYLEPLGYYGNNMFLTDWSEEDFRDLSFYDIYEILYQREFGYAKVMDVNVSEKIYEIPKKQFEDMIQSCFDIDSATLQQHTVYDSSRNCYRYRPRGFDELCTPDFPKPEVVAYEENKDGTITLTVHAVWEWGNNDQSVVHEVVVRPKADGGAAYVSNHRRETPNQVETIWYTDRIPNDTWKGQKIADQKATGQEAVNKEATDQKTTDRRMTDRKAENTEDENTTEKQMDSLLGIIEKKGHPVYRSEAYTELHHYEKVLQFLQNAQKNQAGKIVLYRVYDEGFAQEEFYFDGRDMYERCTKVNETDAGKMKIASTTYHQVKRWRYTEKGWFCYELCVPEPPVVTEVVNGDEMIRVLPMNPTYREMAVKYLNPIGYQGNNLFCSDWDMDHLEGLDYNGLFEYLYAMKYGKRVDEERFREGIPEELFITVIQSYLDIPTEQIKQYAMYEKDTGRFPWSGLGCINYGPSAFGTSIPEIVAMTKNTDGTMELVVDAVCELTGEDQMFSHVLKVRPDGKTGMRFLSNRVLTSELETIPDYQYRLTGTP
ncbi:MAG: DUF6070 family protein [Lachnospiraceae bacterium]|nr:DUF6070 family protein [Lachnospiraceae bacterium]